MEIHRQTCQKCGSHSVTNLLVREGGKPDLVFAQCNQCQELVARYIIGQRGYYHHGKDFESYLQGLNRGGFYMSGRDLQEEFQNIQQEVEQQFEQVQQSFQQLHPQMEKKE